LDKNNLRSIVAEIERELENLEELRKQMKEINFQEPYIWQPRNLIK
jgi:hypothetical protein